MNARRTFLALLAAGTLLPASQASANVDLADLEDEVMCVVCKRTLATSGGDAADDQREVMQGMIDRGLSKAEIKDELVREYGDQVLVDDGNPIAAAAPVLAALVGAGSIALLLRRRRSDRAPSGELEATSGAAPPTPGERPGTSPAPAPLSAADDARIDAELAERG